jgi:hypothetical protein
LCRATFAQRVVLNLAAANSFLRPHVSRVLNFDEVSFAPCHFSTAEHLPAGGSRLPPGSAISPGASLPLLAALRGQIADPTPLPRFSDRHHCGVFLDDLLMLLYGLHHSWIGLISVASLQAVVSFRPSFRSINNSSHLCLTKFNFFSHSGQHFLLFGHLRLVGVHLGFHFFPQGFQHFQYLLRLHNVAI